jgi:hypothetical protein
MKQKSLDFVTQGERNGGNGEDVSDLDKRPTRTRAACALHQKKFIAPSSDIGFSCFLA